MRKVILTLSVFITLHTFAQKNKGKGPSVPDFGKVTREELEMKECDFDQKAEAVVLFDVGEISWVIGNPNLDFTRHVRIKILQEKGRNQADIHLPFYSYQNLEDIKDISAQTYNIDGSGNIVVTKLDKKLIYDKKLNKRVSEKAFTFPEVKAGTVIEFKYKYSTLGLINWYFQRTIPVKYSLYKLDFPKEIELYSNPRCSLPYETDRSEESTRTVQTFSMKNVPALRDEPYILNDEDYMERVETKPVAVYVNGFRQSLLSDWPKMIKALMEDEDFGVQLKKDIPRTDDLNAKLLGVKDPYTKMAIIHQYVRDNMKWNGYTSIWALDGIKSAWKDKKGTTGEINLILINLLKDAGLNAHPVLVSTHDNGLVNTIDAQTSQFNKVLAYVEIGDKSYVLDATEKETPSYLIPHEVLLTEGLVIEKLDTYEWGWKTLWDNSCTSKYVILTSANIDESGKMTAETKLTSYDYARVERAPYARKGVKDYTDKFLKLDNPGITIDSVKFENLETDSLPLTQSFFYQQQLPASGNYRYFSTNLFTGLEKNPFLSENRFSDVFFGNNQSFSIIGTYFIPENYQVEGVPRNIKMIMPDTSIVISRIVQSDDISIYVSINVDFKKPFYPINQYAEFREFYKKLEDLLNEQYVLVKKK